jgi:polyferredoxin
MPFNTVSKEDLIQIFLMLIVLIIGVFFVYSLLKYPFWVWIAELVIAALGVFALSKRIKL